MTKLEQLNVFLSERLSTVVSEILDTVSRMMQEYEEETVRIRKENDYLKEMLKITGWSFTEINPGVFLGNEGISNLKHESETCEGWCQNPEQNKESTRIKMEQPDPPYPDSEHTDEFPIPDLVMGSPISDAWNSLKNSKRKSKLKLKKKHYCLYCRKPSLRMTQHLLTVHAKEPEVAKALSYDKRSKERKQLLDLLQSKGNLLHKDVGMNRTSSSKQHVTTGYSKDFVQCAYCLGLYCSKSITNHIKRCKPKYPYKAESSTASPMSCTIASPPDKELQRTNQVSSPNSDRSCTSKQENPNPEPVRSHVSETGHSTPRVYTDTEFTGSPCEDFGFGGEQLLADIESESDLAPDTSLVRNDREHKNPTHSSPIYTTSKSEDQKADAEQNGNTVENRRRSFHVETQSSLIGSASDMEEGGAQNAQLHTCQHCSATFCSPYHLRRHEYTHTGERPFWCSECNMGFIQKYRYRNHRMTYHGEKHSSICTNQPRRRKKRSSGKEEPTETEIHQQHLDEFSREEFDSTNRDAGSTGNFQNDKITDWKEDREPVNGVPEREPEDNY